MKRATLRRAIQRLRRSLRDITFEQIETGMATLEKGGTGTRMTLPQGLMLTIGYDTFVIAPEEILPYGQQPDAPQLSSNQIVTLRLPGITPLAGTPWQIKATFLTQKDIEGHNLRQTGAWEAYLDADLVGPTPHLRTRQPGDIFYPLGLQGHRQKLSDFMINEKIPADQRDHIPLLVANDQVLWICGYRPDARARVRSTTQHILHLKFESKE
jgi:tRNA(Ile)-lysidine synthase